MFRENNNKTALSGRELDHRSLAERLLETYYLEDILEWSGMSEEDALEALLNHGSIKIPEEIVPVA